MVHTCVPGINHDISSHEQAQCSHCNTLADLALTIDSCRAADKRSQAWF